MFQSKEKGRLGRNLLFAGAALGACLAASTAFADGCPADQKKPDARGPVDFKPVGVTDTVIASIDVSKAPFDIKDRNFRMRKLTIEPMGIVPWHSHADRPAIIYIVEGEIVEYASNCAVPIVHKAGDVVAETPEVVSLVEEPRRQDRRAALRRSAEGSERQEYVTRFPPLDVTPSLPPKGVTSILSRSSAMNELSPAVAAPELGVKAHSDRRPPPLHRHRADGLLDRRRPLRHPGYPPLARQALRRRPRRHGICRQRKHHGHGGVGPRRRLFQPRDRSEKGHPAQPRLTRNPHHTARSRARPHHLHPASRDPGALHGGRLHSHPCLSRRALQRRRFGERLCRLHHRQRRQQPHRAPDLGGRRRPFRYRRQFLLLRLA